MNPRLSQGASVSIIVTCYVLSRVTSWRMGFRLLTIDLWQCLDFSLLQHDLLKSLVLLHAQPPLFNLLIGTLLKVFPEHWKDAYTLLSLSLGFIASLCLYFLMVRLGTSLLLALIMTVLFIFNPATLLYEQFLFYSHIVMTLLCLSAFCLERFLATRHIGWLIAFFLLTASVCLTHALFHLVWLVGTALALILWGGRARYDRKKIALVALVPCLLVGAWYAKNWYLFGHFSASTWLGMNVAKRWAGNEALQPELALLVERGAISQVSVITSFRSLDRYAGLMEMPEPWGHAALDSWYKSDGNPNFNHTAYIRVADQYLEDAVPIAKAMPGAMARSVLVSWLFYFQPDSQLFLYDYFQPQGFARIRWLDTVYRRVYYLQYRTEPESVIEWDYPPDARHRYYWQMGQAVSLSLLVGTCLVMIVVPRQVWRLLRVKQDDRYALVLLYLWYTVVYAAVVGNTLELYENHRFRFETYPLWIILVVVSLVQLWSQGAQKGTRGVVFSGKPVPAPPTRCSTRTPASSGEVQTLQ
ncbi:MAG: hypothetical protein HC884_11195 [Chloroflexaceae bacterium]|nr:hypothetical protein [Chloroflexaceae bacterium]